MELEITAKRLAELGHSTRLAIFRHLVKCGPDGCPVGDVQKMLDIPGSTLSHHLGRLMSAGLVEQRRDGRTLYCRPVYSALDEVINFLTDECCAGHCTV
ncbi:MAG: metalloregulator ArsR/SmtB family transcription factor [Candidatus Sedimenticola sp. (ex Thyasira tokunagai)]